LKKGVDKWDKKWYNTYDVGEMIEEQQKKFGKPRTERRVYHEESDDRIVVLGHVVAKKCNVRTPGV